ncbi:hypothetical protein DFJ73DRAFT_756076 [Zopfochytrium polystomum]|nr:hypothetical protein DFJ73DRAFT_756076 [Zopfochytrium polystomum]
MDPSRYVANSNVMVALGVSLITTLVSFWEVIAKMTNPVLVWTLAISATGHLTYTFGSAVIARNVATDGDLDRPAWRDGMDLCLMTKFSPPPPTHDTRRRAPLRSVADVIGWFSIVFHTTYRTVLIMYPKSSRIWIIPSIILVVQTNHFSTATPQLYWLSLIIMCFVASVDSVFFVLAQYKIITTLRQVSNTPVSPLHIAKTALRILCYTSAVVMEFISLGQYFYSIDSGK